MARKVDRKAAKKSRGKKMAGVKGKSICGFYGGKVISRWQAAFEHRVASFKKHIYISCSEAMAQLKDDAGNCSFSDCDIKKNQWKLQRMFTQLETDNFKEPTKGEMYIMLYELYYSTRTAITEDGKEIEVEPTISERLLIQREMIKMGGHYAPEKSEGKLTGKLVVEFGTANLHPQIPDAKNRIAKYN